MHAAPPAMHIPDGFLSTAVSLAGWILAVSIIAIAMRKTRQQLGERQVPVMGVLAAFVFAAQAINFPVAAGTSGHLLGGALVAIVLGPWAAVLVMTSVVGVQAFLFQDGGLLALGWNIINMGVLTAFSGFAAYRLLTNLIGSTTRARAAAAFAGAWVSVEIGAFATAMELAVSGTTPLALALPAMTGVHALIGIGEGLITSGAVALLEVSRPVLLQAAERAPGQREAVVLLAGLAAALLVAVFSPFGSALPDGLESIAGQFGFIDKASQPAFRLLPDYSLPFLGHPVATTIAAVMIGTLIVFACAWLFGRGVLRPDRRG